MTSRCRRERGVPRHRAPVVGPAARPPRSISRGFIFHVQRTAGNRAPAAVCRALLLVLPRHPGNAAVARVLQRAPAIGLGTPQATNEFAKTAVRWWRKYPATTLDNFAFIMVEEASRSLEKIGVPA